MLILNDVHIGHNRQGGTTPASREALRNYLLKSFKEMVHDTTENHVCILGDLFDQFDVDGRDWIATYLILQDWLNRPNGGQMHRLTLVAGNHDWSNKGEKVSSFEMLCKVLKEQFGDQVAVVGIDQWSIIEEAECGVFALAHCSNQDIFNAKLAEVLAMITRPGLRVLLHANYDNHFAAQSDHSLNVSEIQARAFAAKGATLYFAHEHQARTALGGSVVVFGNQWPTSVSDCLNNDAKFAHVLRGGVDKIMTWPSEGTAYATIDWRDLRLETQYGAGFIKLVGSASANEAGECISAIAKFRTRSKAFVITNGVKIEGVIDNADLPEAFEAAKAFDVMEFIHSNLDEPQRVAVRKLMEVQS